MPDYTGGYSGAVNQLSEMQSRGVMDQARMQEMAQRALQMIRQQQLLGMRGQGIQALQGAMGPQLPPPPMQAPVAPPPGAMSPGGGNPQVQPQMPAPVPPGGGMPPPPMAAGPGPGPAAGPAAAAPAGPQTIPPFRPMPSAPAGAGAPGMVPAPPAEPAAQPENIVAPQHIDIKGVLTQMDKMGLSPEQKADALEGMMPMIQAAQQQELSFFKAQTQAQAAAINAYRAAMTANYQEGMLKSRKEETERKTAQGDERLRQGQEKIDERKARIGRQAGGTGNISKWEYDPKDPTRVIGGWSKTGKHIKLDEPGVATPAKAGAGAAGAVRQNIVKAGITNSIKRLDEIEKEFGDNVTTTAFFGQHGDNPLTRGIYGAAKGQYSPKQQEADAKWASFIDEAIPVFTGGLRGSDAFRRFLIEQAPGPGDKPATVAEKRRLFRQNIEGTSKAFFNKFSSDPSFWGPGVRPEEVKGGGAAPQQGAIPAGIPEGSKVIGKSPEGKDVFEAPDGKRYTAD